MNSMIETWNSAAELWWLWMMSSCWQSALVGLLLLAVVGFARRWSSPVRYGLLLVALLKFAAPPLWSSPTGLLSLVGPVHHAVHSPVDSATRPAETSPRPESDEHALAVNRVDGSADQLRESAPLEPDETLSASDFPGDPAALEILRRENDQLPASDAATLDVPVGAASLRVRPTWQAWLMLLHFCGTLTVVALVVQQLKSLRRLVRSSHRVPDSVNRHCQHLQHAIGVRRHVRVLQSDKVDSPIAFGILQPTIILSGDTDDLSQSDLRTILGHELAHLRQGDAWTNWLQLVLMAVWWFHPVFWMLHRNLRRVREDCCDDLLIATGLASADDYCDTLLRVASRPAAARIHVACSMADRLHPLGNRLRRILDPNVRRVVRLSIVNLGLVMLAAAVLLPGLRSQLTHAQDATDKAKPTVTADPIVPVAEEFEIPKGLPVAKETVDRFMGYKEYAISFEPLKISGRCVDFNDKPVAGASVMLLLNEFKSLSYIDENGERKSIEKKMATVQSDADGRYEFNIERFPVMEFKPNPVEKPREAGFNLVATADNYAIAWRSPRTLRFQERPAVLDPEEAASLFFAGEPIELDLTFLPEVQVHGVVSDDLGHSLAGATVQLGFVNDARSLAGQGPRSMTYQLIEPASKVDISPGWSISELPEAFRKTTTDNQGRYTLRGMPPNARARFVADYRRSYEMFNGRLSSVAGTSDRNTQYIGMDGEFNVTLTRPRVLLVALSADAKESPQCIVRAEHATRSLSILRDGAMTESVDGIAKLELPPGKYKLFVEPLPGQSLVSVTYEVEVHEQPLEQSAEFTVPAGAEVLLRAVVNGTGRAVEGVGFSVQTEAENPPVELQSQTVFVDHPRTSSSGALQAIVSPGTMSFLPTHIPNGYKAIASKSETYDLMPGAPKVVTFEFEETVPVPVPPDNGILAGMYEKLDRQRRLISSGRYTYRRNNFLRGEITLPELDEVFGLLEGKSAPHAEAILKHVFPSLKLSHQSVMLVHGQKLAVAHTWGGSELSWKGMQVSDVYLQNGVEQLSYSAANNQLDIHDIGKSWMHIGSLDELVTVPSMFRQLPPDLNMEEREGRVFLDLAGSVLVADEQTGFVYQLNSMRPDGSGRTVRQFGPVIHANGAATPALRIEAKFRNHKLDHADVAFLDNVEFVKEFPAGTFSFSAPPGTNILDYRDTDREQVGSSPRSGVTQAPVSDAVAKANESRPRPKPSQEVPVAEPDVVAPPAMKGLRHGDEAPAFEAAGWYDQNGKTDAPDFKGKFVIVSFHGSEPQQYAHENRTLRESLKLFADRDVMFVNVYSSTTSAEKASEFMTQFQLPWKFAIDSPVDSNSLSAGKTFAAFHISRSGTTVVLDSTGRVVVALTHTEQSREAIQTVDRMLGPKK